MRCLKDYVKNNSRLFLYLLCIKWKLEDYKELSESHEMDLLE